MASVEFRRLSERYSAFHQARYMHAKSRYFEGEHLAALELFAKLHSDVPQFADAGFWHARILSQQGYLDEAEALFHSLLSYAPEDSRILYQLGLIQYSRGNYANAIDFLRRATLMRDEVAQSYYQLARLYQELGSTPQAIHALQEARSIATADSSLHAATMRVLAELRRE